jgi:tetratricopeptide (TPR) repeat protein
MTLLIAVALAGVMAQQPETLSLLDDPLYPPPVPRAERARLEGEIAQARGAVGREPSNADAVLRLARAQWELGHVRDSLETLTRALEAKTDTPSIRLERGRGFLALRKFSVAEREFRKAAETLPAAHCGLGVSLYLLEDYKHAHEELKQCAQPGEFLYLAALRAGENAGARPAPPADAHPGPAAITLPGSVAKKEPKPEASLAASYMNAVERLRAGDSAGAKELLKPIVDKRKNEWMEPLYIAAEGDYARILKAEPKKKKKKKR